MQRYVYKVTLTNTGQFYHGVRVSKYANPEDLWVSYFTSSKIVKSLIEQYGKDAFMKEIIFCGTHEEVIAKEVELIDQNWNNPLSLNRNKAGMLKPECYLPENFLTEKRKNSWEKDSIRKKSGNFTVKEQQQHKNYSLRRSLKLFTEKEIEGFHKLSTNRKERLKTTGFTERELEKNLRESKRKQSGNFTEKEKDHYINHSKTMSKLKWFNDGVVSCRSAEVPSSNWKPGKLKKNLRWVNKDGISKMIAETELNSYLDIGWILGRR